MQFELKTLGPWSYYHLPELEESGIVHGFMTKSSDAIIADEEEKLRFAEAFTASATVMLQQQHGEEVHIIEKGERPRAGDGLVLLEKGVMGIIKTADCLPVILYESTYPMAAVVHAGWRGTALKITEKALRRMIAVGGRPDRMGAIVGPGIGPCCYEVGGEVVAAFRRAGFNEHVFIERDGSLFLDLKKANRDLIEAAGVPSIDDADLCTSCRQDLFFSARRNKLAGRQMNFVQLKR
jgi:polyphenol oxidase